MPIACTWDNSRCEGTVGCPPRCPRFFDRTDVPLLARQAESEDLSAVIDMYDDLGPYNRTMGIPPATRSGIDRWLGHLFENGWNLIILDDDIVVGHVAVVPADEESPELVIFVHDEYQNRGIGTELMKQTIAYARESTHDRLTLSVATGNKPAITVYENLAFEVTETQRDELLMEMALDHPLADEVRKPPAKR